MSTYRIVRVISFHSRVTHEDASDDLCCASPWPRRAWPYPSPKGVGRGEAAAHPFCGFIYDLYKCVGDFGCRCLGF